MYAPLCSAAIPRRIDLCENGLWSPTMGILKQKQLKTEKEGKPEMRQKNKLHMSQNTDIFRTAKVNLIKF